MPAVSVVIAAYNPGDLLRRSLGSVLDQTVRDVEVLVVDDASTEDIRSVPGMDDPRVRHLRLPHNRGRGIVRNTGVLEAQSRYVAFLDHDDEWLPTKLERQLEALAEHPGASFCYTDFEWVLFDGSCQDSDTGDVTYAGLLSSQTVLLTSVVMSRDAYFTVGGMSSLLTWGQDFDFFLRCLDGGPAPVYVPQVLARYHLHGANHSRNYRGSLSHRVAVLELHRAKALREDRPEIVEACDRGIRRARELRGAQAFDEARFAYRDRDFAGTARELLEVARSQPRLLAGAVRQRLHRG